MKTHGTRWLVSCLACLAAAGLSTPAAAGPALVVLRETPAPLEAGEAAALGEMLAAALSAAGLPAPVLLAEPPLERPADPDPDAPAGEAPPMVRLERAARLALARASAPADATVLLAVCLRVYAPYVGGSGGITVPLPPALGGGAPTRPARAYIIADFTVAGLPGGEERGVFRVIADSARYQPPAGAQPPSPLVAGPLGAKYREDPMERALAILRDEALARLRPFYAPPAAE